MNKTCAKCGPKPVKEFNWKNKAKKIRQSYCRSCNASRSRKYYKDNREKHLKVVYAAKRIRIEDNHRKVYDYLLTHPCVKCGEVNPVMLDFHHVDPSKKEHCIFEMVNEGRSWSKTEKEISKCQILCANDHRVETARQTNSRKLIWWEQRDSNSHRPD